MSRCPRCGTRVPDGIFAICPRCGATPGSSGHYKEHREATDLEGRPPQIFSAPPGVPTFARRLSRLLFAVVIALVVAAVGFAIYSATVKEEDGSSADPATGSEPAAVPPQTVAQATVPDATPPATTAAAAGTGEAAARTEASCTKLWNASQNAGIRDGVSALGATTARVRASRSQCVVVAILPTEPQTATRFVAKGQIYVAEGGVDRVPEANATFDDAGRLRR